MSRKKKKQKSTVDYYTLPMGEGCSVILDPLCPQSINWYLTEVCGFPTDEEVAKCLTDEEREQMEAESRPAPNSKFVQRIEERIKKGIGAERLEKLQRYHQAPNKCMALFIPSTRDPFCEHERVMRVLMDDNRMEGRKV